jgi:hypothetical protein
MTKRVVHVGSYTRQVDLITVEFTCHRCGRPQSYTMYPGPTPKWCFDCFRDVRREQARLRKRRQRARQRRGPQPGDGPEWSHFR